MTTSALKQVATGAVAANTAPNPKSFAGMLERMKPQLAAALPKHMNADRMVRIALTNYRLTPKLAECTVESVIGSIVQCSQLGLEPGLAGQAYLVPYKRNWKDEHGRWHNTMECQFIPGYRGLISLARRSGEVTSINAEIVYANDEFSLTLGIDPQIHHRPLLDGDRGKPRLVYVVAKFKDGGHHLEWMSIAAVEAVRARSKASTNGPWQTDYDEMVRKTCIRRATKYLPMSVELAAAVAVGDAVDQGQVINLTPENEPEVQLDATASFEDGEPPAGAPTDGGTTAAAPAGSEGEQGGDKSPVTAFDRLKADVAGAGKIKHLNEVEARVTAAREELSAEQFEELQALAKTRRAELA